MPKGYWIPHIDVSDPEGYKAYMAATPPAHEKYHGRRARARRQVRRGRGPRPLAQRSARVPRLRHRARLLSLARISAREGSASAAFAVRFPHRRGLRRSATAARRVGTGRRRAQGLLDRARRCDRCRRLTSPMWPPLSWRSANSVDAIWCAAAPKRWRKATGARRTAVLEFPSYRSGARLLPLGRLSGSEKVARRQGRNRPRLVEGYDGPKF